MTSVMFALTLGRPLVQVLEQQPTGELVIGPRKYVEQRFGSDPFLGFYDWLRSTAGRLVGFRLTLGKGCESLADLVPSHEYVVRHTAHIFSVMFEVVIGEIDEEASTEQDFGESRAFVSPDGTLALIVDAGALTEPELAAIESLSRGGSH